MADSAEKTKAELKAERKAQFLQKQKEEAAAKANSVGAPAEQKSKAQLKAERRAQQEAQRAAKASTKTNAPAQKTSSDVQAKKSQTAPKKPEGKSVPRVSDNVMQDIAKTRKQAARKLDKQKIPRRTDAQKKLDLFSHLHQYEREVSLTRNLSFENSSIHPQTLRLGLQYADGVICGSNARCVALLSLLKIIIQDYETPKDKDLARDLEARIQPNISFLQQCRQLSVSMGNALKYVKWHITGTPPDQEEQAAKNRLQTAIDDFYREKIVLAGQAICDTSQRKIKSGDVIMVYACSSLILKVLCHSRQQGIDFKVVVVDARPKFEGREMLRRLVKAGIKCSYVSINAASYVMREVTKVLFGAHALLANGYVMSRIGTSQLALVARSHNVPVLVCCETYKFVERVQTDSFVFNELGDPDDLVATGDDETPPLSDWRDMQSLRLLNLMYDVTPPDLVTSVVTELGLLPCTSVPVVLRVKQERTEEGRVT